MLVVILLILELRLSVLGSRVGYYVFRRFYVLDSWRYSKIAIVLLVS